MKIMKSFLIYGLMIFGFWILSEILIYFGLNSTYNKINVKNNLPNEISVSRAEATIVNGRINGIIKNSAENNISGKYLKIDLYSSIGNLLGTKYLEIGELGANSSKKFETYFKIQEVKSYDISIVDEKASDVSGDLFLPEDLSKARVILLLAYMIFM